MIATDLLSGQEVVLDRGDAIEAILASTALPGLLPAVPRDGQLLVDGGLADNTAISQAVSAGAERVYVLPSGYSCARTTAPSSAIAMLTQATTVLLHQRLIADIAAYTGRVELVVLPPPCPLHVSPLDFAHARELIGQAHHDASAFLDRDSGRRESPAASIAFHGTHR